MSGARAAVAMLVAGVVLVVAGLAMWSLAVALVVAGGVLTATALLVDFEGGPQ